MMGAFILSLIFFWVGAHAQAPGQANSPKGELTQKDVLRALHDLIKELPKNPSPTKEAQTFYQFETDDRPCPHCPEYLKLIREVNKIVEKVPGKDRVSEDNKSLVQLNRLKFMYYEIKSFDENGGVKCIPYQHADALSYRTYKPDELTLLAEEILSLPNVSDLQYIPKDHEQEIRYFYRGEGAQKEKVIEVVLFPDKKVLIRYHKYTDPQMPQLPNLSFSERPGLERFITDSSDNLLPDVHLIEQKGAVEVGGLHLKTEATARIQKQFMNATLSDGSGKEWLKVEVRNQTLKDVQVTTAIPIKIELTDKMKLGGQVSLEGHRSLRGEQSTPTSRKVTLGLTDHSNEYLITTIVSRDDARDLILSSRYNLGTFGSFSATSLSSTDGGHLKSMTHEMKNNRSSIRTTVGMTNDARRFFEFLREERLSKTSSVVISLKTDGEKKTTLIYQYRMQLK
jgi:hypothetical protein